MCLVDIVDIMSTKHTEDGLCREAETFVLIVKFIEHMTETQDSVCINFMTQGTGPSTPLGHSMMLYSTIFGDKKL